MANKLDGVIRYAISEMQAGNYDLAIAIATRANTPEAQRLFREAVEREEREEKERKASHGEFVKKMLDIKG